MSISYLFWNSPSPPHGSQALRKRHHLETPWHVPCPRTAAPPPSCSLISSGRVGPFVFLGVMVRGSRLGDPEGHVSIHASWSFWVWGEGSSLLTHPLPGCTALETKGGSGGVKLRLVLRPKRTVFTNNYHIIINTRERHDVKMKLLKTFLDYHSALYKLTDNPIRHSSRLWV